MTEKYYEIRKKKDNRNNNLIIKIKEGNLELIIGTKDDLNLCSAQIGKNNELLLNNQYFYVRINEKEAERRKNLYK